MRESQYVEQYLDGNSGNCPYTVSTFLSGELTGTAKDYAGKYQTALQNAIDRRVKKGEVEECVSIGGRLAYRYKKGEKL